MTDTRPYGTYLVNTFVIFASHTFLLSPWFLSFRFQGWQPMCTTSSLDGRMDLGRPLACVIRLLLASAVLFQIGVGSWLHSLASPLLAGSHCAPPSSSEVMWSSSGNYPPPGVRASLRRGPAGASSPAASPESACSMPASGSAKGPILLQRSPRTAPPPLPLIHPGTGVRI